MKCDSCRSLEASDTWSEAIASWLVKHFFPDTLKDERNASYTEGFGEGYRVGHLSGQEIRAVEQKFRDFVNPARKL